LSSKSVSSHLALSDKTVAARIVTQSAHLEYAGQGADPIRDYGRKSLYLQTASESSLSL
jgi:hypothetical protein